MKVLKSFLILFFFFGGTFLLSQERNGSFEISPFYGDFVQLSGDRLPDANLYGLRLSYMLLDKISLEGAFTKLSNAGEEGDIYEVNGLYHLWPEKKFVPFITAGIGQVSLFDENDFSFNFGFGVKYSLNDLIGLRSDIRNVISGSDFYKNSLVYTLGLTFQFGGEKRPPIEIPLAPDNDNDGIRDSLDYCLNTPQSSKAFVMKVDTRGCPVDSDGDGTPDYMEDDDSDGVINYNDMCPNTLKGYPVNEEGCDKDSDADGIVDGREMEIGTDPNQTDTDGDGLSDYDEIYKYKTDPIKADSDGDGLSDYDEIFKYKTNPLKLDTDGDGYKDGEEILIYKSDPSIYGDVYKELFETKMIHFDFNSFKIRKDAKPVLDEIVEFMLKYAEAHLIIKGHTCSIGPDNYNMKLSLKRAEAAKKYLVKKGIPEDKISTEGFGETKPIDDNKTAKGRANNRRAEFNVE